MTDKIHQCISESELVDYLLGKINQDKAESIDSHIRQCKTCSKAIDQWQELLKPVHNQYEISSKRLKRRLTIRYVTRYLLMPQVKISSAAFAMLAGLVIFIWLGLMNSDSNFDPFHYGAAKKSFKELAIVQDPSTVQYEVMPISAEEVKGYVWVNQNSKEILLLVKGLQNMYERDYQVWVVKKEQRSNMGLVEWHDGFAHFYYQGEGVDQAENIAVSLEPKGGSVHPTGPDAIFVKLKEPPKQPR
jgi:anti-sigma-K factor RskA